MIGFLTVITFGNYFGILKKNIFLTCRSIIFLSLMLINDVELHVFSAEGGVYKYAWTFSKHQALKA